MSSRPMGAMSAGLVRMVLRLPLFFYRTAEIHVKYCFFTAFRSTTVPRSHPDKLPRHEVNKRRIPHEVVDVKKASLRGSPGYSVAVGARRLSS